ncbi:MAG: GAF domain-containing protein [Saprospiraceae bacterium]|nr:GAF domain-containing protein [Saprospiraceae bacterium]
MLQGNFNLFVRAKQPGGYQWSPPLEIKINVFVPWFLNKWFLLASLGLLLIAIAYYFRFFVRRRFRRLQKVLKFANEKLAIKEEQLSLKIQEFKEQQEELANANQNIDTLELFIKEMPEKATWHDIIAAMGKAVNISQDIDAFEISFKEENEIVHRGYSNQERGGFTFRTKPFNPKSSLTCWAMANEQEVVINDFEKEHSMYVAEKPVYLFRSLLFIPFKLENNQPVVLCAYSTKKHHFDNNDLTMFRILARFIYFSIHQEISKKT